jgi:hypothetical protein
MTLTPCAYLSKYSLFSLDQRSNHWIYRPSLREEVISIFLVTQAANKPERQSPTQTASRQVNQAHVLVLQRWKPRHAFSLGMANYGQAPWSYITHNSRNAKIWCSICRPRRHGSISSAFATSRRLELSLCYECYYIGEMSFYLDLSPNVQNIR